MYTQTATKLLTPIIKSFVTLKVLIQNNDDLWYELYAVRLYRVLLEVDTLPPFFYYELLLLHISGSFTYRIVGKFGEFGKSSMIHPTKTIQISTYS